ncbi:hypothetical protein CANINC_003510 [Pichia inconspicua]|uniref:Uncharacterized protein n=1 Tax=Pichia inconspicua TaxID=52247 RepID=A0A4T0WYG9_9ASCO|nr:hypothetical protein CANINC_003510 [[Candida] inconspicua]
MEEAQKKVNAVISDNISTSLMLNTIRRNDDLVSRVNARESDDICCGIVLDTGAQASVTGSVENLHLFRLTLVTKEIDSKTSYQLIMDSIPTFIKIASTEAVKIKTRFNAASGPIQYLDDLVTELETFSIPPAVRMIFLSILNSTPENVMRNGIIPPQVGWTIDGAYLNPKDIMRLETRLSAPFGYFLNATGWNDYVKIDNYLSKTTEVPQEAIEFSNKLFGVDEYKKCHFSQLPYAVKIAWIRSKPDTDSGIRLVQKYVLDEAIATWSLIKHCRTKVEELTSYEAKRTYQLLIDEKVKNHSKRLKDEQESVIKYLVSLAVDPNKFDVNQDKAYIENCYV